MKQIRLFALLTFLCAQNLSAQIPDNHKTEQDSEAAPMPSVGESTPVDLICNRPEQRPQFPGGDEALNKFLADSLIYPQAAKTNGITGKVVVQFLIGKDGSITQPQILSDIGAGCGKEALRLVKSMPKWIPGKQNGRVVRVQYTLPVEFRLD